MKDKIDNLKLFISQHHAYFDEIISPQVTFIWDDNSWHTSAAHKGVFSGARRGHLEFSSFKRMTNIVMPGECVSKQDLSITLDFSNFLKAMVVYLIKRKNHKTSLSALNRDLILMKRIYARLIVNGHSAPMVHSISSDVIAQAMEALAFGTSNISTIADHQTAMRNICRHITVLGITLNPLDYEVTQKRSSTFSTAKAKQAAEKFHNADYVESIEDEQAKVISINTFLNIIAARSMVTTVGEKVMLNMLLLLMVTGFRYGECERIRANALKRLEVEDKNTAELLESKGLKPYYLGIVYVGEKGAGTRTHWVEPLAIDLVEMIFNDTISLTKSLRTHIKQSRELNFESLLPNHLKSKSEVLLDDIVRDIIESFSASSKSSASYTRDATKKFLDKVGVYPNRIMAVNRRRNHYYYSTAAINDALKKKVSDTNNLNHGFIYNFRDSKTGEQQSYNIEDLLFIIPEGSSSLNRALTFKILPVSIPIENIQRFIGNNNGISLFKKYNLVESDGTFPALTTHIPRHTINTFLAIAGISDHIQAAMMGRVDITQNSTYQHLAIEERALASVAVTNGTQLDLFMPDDTEVTTLLSPLDNIKQSAEIKLNPELTLENAIVQNTHTFTTKDDVSDFISDVFNSSGLDLMAGLSDAAAKLDAADERKQILDRHADIYPLDFGSCMRKLAAWSCPYGMKCQEAAPCPYFTLLGRADDIKKLQSKVNVTTRQIAELEQLFFSGTLTQDEFAEALEDLALKQSHLSRLQDMSLKLEDKKITIDLFKFDNHDKPKTLANIFAIEHRKLELKERAI